MQLVSKQCVLTHLEEPILPLICAKYAQRTYFMYFFEVEYVWVINDPPGKCVNAVDWTAANVKQHYWKLFGTISPRFNLGLRFCFFPDWLPIIFSMSLDRGGSRGPIWLWSPTPKLSNCIHFMSNLAYFLLKTLCFFIILPGLPPKNFGLDPPLAVKAVRQRKHKVGHSAGLYPL